MRTINLIVVHCSATPEGRDVTARDIDAMHKVRGFHFAPPNTAGLAHIGYHWFIRLNGEVEAGRPEATIGAHAEGFNATSIGICYAGGLAADAKTPKDTRTAAQLVAMRRLIAGLRDHFPHVRIVGHRDLSVDLNGDGVVEPQEWMKACPSFDVAAWLKQAGLA